MSRYNGHPPMPTGGECEALARLPDFNGRPAFAAWYPQMGGYAAKAVIVLMTDATEDGCFDAYVWHDGEFPFHEVGDDPARVHHCSAGQFVEFGNEVLAMFKRVPAAP